MPPRVLHAASALLVFFGPLSSALACDLAAERAQAEAALRALDALRAEDFFREADGITPCPDAPPEERAALLRVQGASAALQKDTARAARLFGEARALDPLGQLPARSFPPTHPVARLYQLSAPQISLVTDVTPDPTSSTSVALVAVPTPLPPAPERPPRRAPLVLGAALSSLAAGGLVAAAGWVDGRADRAAEDALGRSTAAFYAEQERYRGQQLGLQLAAGGSAALAVGLVGATVSLSW